MQLFMSLLFFFFNVTQKNKKLRLAFVVHTFNSQGLVGLCECEASLGHIVSGQPGLPNETLSQKRKEN